MKKILIIASGIALGLVLFGVAVSALIVAGTSDNAAGTSANAQPGNNIGSSDSTPSPTPPVEPESTEPEGKYVLTSCDIELSSGLYAADTLIGSARVINSGDVSLDATVTFAWLLGDGSKVKAEPKHITLGTGQRKLVFFSAKTQQTSLFQAHPGYYNGKNCKTVTEITG